jgi:hypothetical protein
LLSFHLKIPPSFLVALLIVGRRNGQPDSDGLVVSGHASAGA